MANKFSKKSELSVKNIISNYTTVLANGKEYPVTEIFASHPINCKNKAVEIDFNKDMNKDNMNNYQQYPAGQERENDGMSL